MAKALLILGMAVVVAVCNRQLAAWQYPAPSTATRPANVPAADVLTLAKQNDVAAVANVASDPAINKAVVDYLGPAAPQWKIFAARDVDEYVLLWIGFPKIADGGIDLVYSKSGKRIEWQFLGGIRG